MARRQQEQIKLIGHNTELRRIELQREMTSGGREASTCLSRIIVIWRESRAIASVQGSDKLVIRGRKRSTCVISQHACRDVVQAYDIDSEMLAG